MSILLEQHNDRFLPYPAEILRTLFSRTWVLGRFMRFYIILVIGLSLPTQVSGQNDWKKEEDFWTEMVQLEKVMFSSTDDVSEQLRVVNNEYMNSAVKNSTMFSALFASTVTYHEYRSPRSELVGYLEENLDGLPDSNQRKHMYNALLAILQYESEDIANANQSLEQLKTQNAHPYIETVQLTIEPSESHFNNLQSYCTNRCHFYLYHESIASYLMHIGHYTQLEEFAANVIDEFYTLESENMDIRSVTFLAYIYVAQKCQHRDIGLLDEAMESVANDIGHLSGLLMKFENLLATKCQ